MLHQRTSALPPVASAGGLSSALLILEKEDKVSLESLETLFFSLRSIQDASHLDHVSIIICSNDLRVDWCRSRSNCCLSVSEDSCLGRDVCTK